MTSPSEPPGKISAAQRAARSGHPGCVIWLTGLSADLKFTAHDRTENIRRVGEVARIMADAGIIIIVAFISPFRADRDRVRSIVPAGRFIEVFINAPLAVCEQRDPKGLYARA